MADQDPAKPRGMIGAEHRADAIGGSRCRQVSKVRQPSPVGIVIWGSGVVPERSSGVQLANVYRQMPAEAHSLLDIGNRLYCPVDRNRETKKKSSDGSPNSDWAL
jgi:hypothetical protein